MNTLYEILEVSEKASKEVIEKAYRVLAKKYHPDVQTSENKVIAETKMKQVNEAYSILIDDIKRKEYDESIAKQRQMQKQEEMYYQDIEKQRYESQLRKQQEQIERNIKQQYQNDYYSILRNLGYKIKERWTWRKTKILLVILLAIIVIAIVLWFLPVTHNAMINLYETNKVVKIIVDIILGIIVAFFKTIGSIFTGG